MTQELSHGHLEDGRDMSGDKDSGLILEGKFRFKENDMIESKQNIAG